jgi:hypothetical protein
MKNLMYIIGVVFVLVGIIGFFSDPILGIIDVDAIHNIIHLATGILAIVFAMQGEARGRKFFLIFGIVYALITVLGFVAGEGKILGLVSINGAGNYFHLVTAIVFLIIGLKKPAMSGGSMSPNM